MQTSVLKHSTSSQNTLFSNGHSTSSLHTNQQLARHYPNSSELELTPRYASFPKQKHATPAKSYSQTARQRYTGLPWPSGYELPGIDLGRLVPILNQLYPGVYDRIVMDKYIVWQLIIANGEPFFADSVEVGDREGVRGEDGLVGGEGGIGGLDEGDSSSHFVASLD